MKLTFSSLLLEMHSKYGYLHNLLPFYSLQQINLYMYVACACTDAQILVIFRIILLLCLSCCVKSFFASYLMPVFVNLSPCPICVP